MKRLRCFFFNNVEPELKGITKIAVLGGKKKDK